MDVRQRCKQGLKQLACCFANLVRPQDGIAILTYHRIAPDGFLSVSPEDFDAQMRVLSEYFDVISLEQAVSRLREGVSSRNCVCVTFDDGFRDNWTTAYPILEKYCVPATVFVAMDAVRNGSLWFYDFDMAVFGGSSSEADLTSVGLGRHTWKGVAGREEVACRLHASLKKMSHEDRLAIVGKVAEGKRVERVMMTPDECRELASSKWVDVGAHTISHPLLAQLDEVELQREIGEGKVMLEDMIHSKVSLFSYPNGTRNDFDDRVISVVKKAGFIAATTTMPGLNVPGDDLYSLKRFDVSFGYYGSWTGRCSEALFRAHASGRLSRFEILLGR
ncbi:polysaccharide deacetylase family protein [Pseudodesulfovibrio cashew]|uniref:Polysaccharide deacetylase family protein n=1 Tax=Pseudodesulfovibrio cashew TaxID=2678688 RepID=A0A6I6JDS4_9BACT|nr:polysaccharide deacetylase family protein [Pseudodesulfovibrio cashew]QGY39168.1 polysaccharide deacetylase family protein [Pseudodesulfovibrio cashew]